MSGYEEFSGLGEDTGFVVTEPVAPEEETFHSVYIGGQDRENHIGITEKAGKLHVRGVEYNKEHVFMIPFHVKDILVKNTKKNGRDVLECFSWKGKKPWTGVTGRTCGVNKEERSTNSFCEPCRAQLIMAGILCNEKGQPTKDDKDNYIFGFLRGRGTKYPGVFDYLREVSKMDLDPIFTPETKQSKAFEMQHVDHKRFVTKITIGSVSTAHGKKNVFKLTPTVQLPRDIVLKVLGIAKETVDEFSEKFDWSRRTREDCVNEDQSKKEEGLMAVDDVNSPGSGEESVSKEEASNAVSEEDTSFEFDSF